MESNHTFSKKPISNNLFLSDFKLLFLIVLIVCASVQSFAATKTWSGGTGTGKNWTTGANWGGTAPVANDDVVFNTAGSITFSTMPSSVAYNSITISQGTVTLVAGSSMTLTLGGNAGDAGPRRRRLRGSPRAQAPRFRSASLRPACAR